MKTTRVEMHDECVELVSGQFRIAVTTQVGPRVIGGYIGDSGNIFRVLPIEPLPDKEDYGFRLYGGHRLWQSPEVFPRTYGPDNAKVIVTETETGVEFLSQPEEYAGIEKCVVIEPLGGETFRLTHTITNRTAWAIELAPWALSVMAPGGVAVIPQHRSEEACPYTPHRSLVYWAYSDPNDPRLVYGKDYLLLKQDSSAAEPCKVGFNAARGWIAYVNQGVALVKSCEYDPEAEYPDNGCNVESYTCADFLEIETLAPLHILEPGETAEHVEIWTGLAGLPEIGSEADLDDRFRVFDQAD